MIISDNTNSLTKEWALKRINRTAAPDNLFIVLKLYRIEKVLTKYKALIAMIFLLATQFFMYDFDMSEYTTSNPYGTNVAIEEIKMSKSEYS